MTSDVDAELEGIRRERKAREASHGGNRHALSAGLNVWNAGNDTAAPRRVGGCSAIPSAGGS
jgi:hypothetical protein